MKRAIIAGAAGLIVGLGGGYLVAKRKFDKKLKKELEAIKETQAAIDASKKAKEESKEAEVAEAQEKETKEEPDDEDEENGHVDVYRLAEEEQDDDDDYWPGYETPEERELRLEKEAYQREVNEYIGSQSAYNITQQQFEERNGNDKVVMMICRADDRAYNADTGEEIEDYHLEIMDDELGTLEPDKADEFGCYYVHSERSDTDYEVRFSLRDWM